IKPRDLFNEKQKANKNLSVRAFALKIGLSETTLRKVLGGERKLGYRLAREIAPLFAAEVLPEKGKRKRKTYSCELDSNSSIQVNWLHLAILEMIKLNDFSPSVNWAASRLGVPEEVVEKALEVMQKASMIEIIEDSWVDLTGN